MSNKGTNLLKYYNNSPYAIITDSFKHQSFHPWLFVKAPQVMVHLPLFRLSFLIPLLRLYINVAKKTWSNRDTQLQYMMWLRSKLGFTRDEDCYKLTVKLFLDNHGRGTTSTTIIQ